MDLTRVPSPLVSITLGSMAKQQIVMLAAVHYPGTPEMQAQRASKAAACEQHSNESNVRSDWWRKAALMFVTAPR
jgi:hypothetical protein